MSELIKKQIVTEVMYLKEDGKITIDCDESRVLFQRYRASAEGVTSYGPSEDAAIRNFKRKLSETISTTEFQISQAKKKLKEHTNKLRALKLVHAEVKKFQNA